MKPSPEGLADILPLLRSASHVDHLRMLTEALDRKLTDPSAPSLDVMLGFATPGPSFARSAEKKRRDAILRDYRRRELPDASDSEAARDILSIVAAYSRVRLGHDLRDNLRPLGTIEALAFDAAKDERAFPSFDYLRGLLGKT